MKSRGEMFLLANTQKIDICKQYHSALLPGRHRCANVQDIAGAHGLFSKSRYIQVKFLPVVVWFNTRHKRWRT